jgi:hypothetical protein
LLVRMGLCSVHRSTKYCQPKLKKNEWLIPDLAKRLAIPAVTLFQWIRRDRLTARQLDGPQGRWIIWADAKELKRIQKLHALPRGYWGRKHWFEGKEKV